MAQNNVVQLIGNLGSDPTVHTDRNGNSFIRFTIATTDSYKDEKTNEWKELPSIWHTIFAFSSSAQQYAGFYRKGQRVKVTGRLSYREQEVMIDGQTKRSREAIINARNIEPAPLQKKASGSKDKVTEITGTAVEFGGGDKDDDTIPF